MSAVNRAFAFGDHILGRYGRLALWGAAFITAYRGQSMLESRQHLGEAVVYMAVATVFIVLACWGMRGEERAPPDEAEGAPIWERLRPQALPLALLFIALGLGIAFRLYRLNSEPFGIWFDEASNGLLARDILNGDFPPIFIGGFTQLPSLFFYVYAGAFAIMGDGILTLRTVSAIAGVLAVVFVFLLARELFGWRVGALATFFLAVMRWHVNFSRFGVTNIWAIVFAVAAVYFLVRGLRGKGWWNLVAAGVFTGLGPYAGFYTTFIPFVMGLFWLHTAFSHRVLSWRNHILAIVLVGAVAIATYSPVGVWALQHRDEYTARTSEASILKDKTREQQVRAVLKSTKQHALMFNSQGDSNGRHNLSGSPILDTFTGIFLVLGIGICLSRAHRAQDFLLIAWLPIMLLHGILSLDFEAPQAFRASAVAPAVAMLAAQPLGALWDMASPRSPPVTAEASAGAGSALRGSMLGASVAALGRYAPAVLVGLTLLFFLAQTAYHNFDTYFNVQLHNSRTWLEFGGEATFVAREMDRLQADHRFLVSSLFYSPTLEFVYPPAADLGLVVLDPTGDLPLSESRPTAVFLDITKGPFSEWLRALYPGAQFREVKPPGEGQPTVVYELIVPPEEIDRLRGVEATYRAEGGNVIARREPKIDFDWTSSPPAPFPFAAQWSGLLNVTVYGDHELSVQAPGRIILRLDGEVVAEGDDRVAVTRRLFRGRHQLELEVAADGPGRVVLSDNGEPVPESAYFAPSPEGIGLLGTFYTTADWSGELVLEQLDPFVGFRYHAELPFGSPFSAIWRGKLRVPVTGSYPIEIEALDQATVQIDGVEVISTLGAPAAQLDLTEGLHDIEVRFTNAAGFAQVYLYWTQPGHDREVVPSNVLYPP